MFKPEVTDFVTGVTRIVETQENIVVAAVEVNLRLQTQTAGITFCLSPLVDAFGPCDNNEASCNDVIVGSFIPPR